MIHQHFVDIYDNPFHVRFFQATGSHSCRANAHPRRNHRRLVIKRNHIFIDRDVSFNQRVFGQFTRQRGIVATFRAQIDQHQVVVGSPRNDGVTPIHKSPCHRLRVGLNLINVVHIIVAQSLSKCNGFGRNDMLQRAALCAGKHA